MEDIGYIYCFSNPIHPNTYKIGFTKNTPEIRKKQLHTSGVVLPFEVEYYKKIKNYKIKEKIIHDLLDEYRVSSDREFFEVSLSVIRFCFDLIAGEIYDHEDICENTTEGTKKVVSKYSVKQKE